MINTLNLMLCAFYHNKTFFLSSSVGCCIYQISQLETSESTLPSYTRRVTHGILGRTGVTRCRLNLQEKTSKAMSEFSPDKEVAATIPRLLGDSTSQTIQLPFHNCGKNTLLAQILGIAWFRILESLHQCSRQFQTKFPGVIQNTHTSCNPQRLPLILISNMMEHISVNLFLCSSGQIILQSASYFANILQHLFSSLIPWPPFLHYSQVPLIQDVGY